MQTNSRNTRKFQRIHISHSPPQSSVESSHQFCLADLLLTLLREVSFSLPRHLSPVTLISCLRLSSYIIHELQKSCASHVTSLASTPATTPSTPQGGLRTMDVHQHPTSRGSRTAGCDTEGEGGCPQRLGHKEASVEGNVDPLEEKKREIVSCYLTLFPSLVPEGVQVDGTWELRSTSVGERGPRGEGEEGSQEVTESACHLLFLVSQLGGEEVDCQGE